MAVVMMGGDDKKPIFHDFLAMSCENSPAKLAAAGVSAELITMTAIETEASESASASAGVSSIGQGRQTANNSAVFLIHERKDNSSKLEASNTFSGKKRSNSDSAYMGFITDKIKPVCAEAAECSRSLKMLGKEVISDRSGKNQDELQIPIQSPLRRTPLHSPLGSRPVLYSSKLERPIPTNHSSIVQYPYHIAKTGLFSSSYVSKDANASTILMSQPAADEGSRTGIKSSGVLNAVTSSSGPGEQSIARVLPYCSRPKCMQIHEPVSSNASRCNGLSNVGRQMTVFYAGQAHVFDDVHANKAEVIMALAGSTGGSWSTTYSQKPATSPSSGEVPVELIQRHIKSFPSIQVNPEHALCQVDKTTLTRDIPSLTSEGQQSGRVVKDARSGIQAPSPSPAGQREAT